MKQLQQKGILLKVGELVVKYWELRTDMTKNEEFGRINLSQADFSSKFKDLVCFSGAKILPSMLECSHIFKLAYLTVTAIMTDCDGCMGLQKGRVWSVGSLVAIGKKLLGCWENKHLWTGTRVTVQVWEC